MQFIDAYQFLDGLGRPHRSYLQEGGTYSVTDSEYDLLGRVWRVSNPYRTTVLNGAINPSGVWTTTGYDSLGRVQSVTTPDAAVVTTNYSGQVVTVTDQAGKVRTSVTDALGRLQSVTEAANDPNYNYQTSYQYDALDNLRLVTQGTQTRSFAYDSLKRLRSASNPESGTSSYSYDPNGNLLTRTDARGVLTSYSYDALNRVKTRTYSNDPASTPAVSYQYDGVMSPAGLPTPRAN